MEKHYCACGCGTELTKSPKHGWAQYAKGHNQKGKVSPLKIIPSTPAPLCACGCGNAVVWNNSTRRWNRYLLNHGRTGVVHSPEAIQKMKDAAAMRSEKVAEDNRKRIWTEESRRKLSESKKKIKLPQEFGNGENNPMHKHGRKYTRVSESVRQRVRKSLIERRGLVCETCRVTIADPRLLHMHHIDENPLNNTDANLKLLCQSCHWKTTHIKE